MNLSAIFVGAFAVLCLSVCGYAVFRVWRAKDFPNKPLWVFGCLFGFVGFAVDPKAHADLLLQLGVQIPVVYGVWSSTHGLSLKASFPIVAVFALLKLERHSTNA